MRNIYLKKDQGRLDFSRERVEKTIIGLTKSLFESTVELEMIREAEKKIRDNKFKNNKNE